MAALSSGEDRWKCKIGSAASADPSKRISQQAIAMTTVPVLGLVIRTENGLVLEKHLQGLLKGQRADCPGKEWFLTSPDEIETMWRDLGNSPRSYGWFVRKGRMRKRLSQTQLAELCGLRQRTVSDVENDKGVQLSTLYKIFDVLGIKVSFSLPEEKREYIPCLPGGGGR
jgi:DNA-binding Xre family transcriptional regulator